MKRAKNVISMLVTAQLFLLSLFCVAGAREKIIDENFDTGYTAGQKAEILKFGTTNVLSYVTNGGTDDNLGTVTIDKVPSTENMALKSTMNVAAHTSGKRNIIYIFPGNQLLSKTAGFWSISWRMMIPKSGDQWSFSMKNSDGSKSTSVLRGVVKENKVQPVNGSSWNGHLDYQRYWTPGEFFTIKVIFNMANKTYDYYFNGELVIADGQLNQNVDWSKGGYYMTLIMDGIQESEGEKDFPATSVTSPSIYYFDNLQIYSYQDTEVEAYPTPDCFCAPLPYTGTDEELTLVESIRDANGRTRLGLDFINRSGAEKPLCIAVATYEKDAEGFSRLLDVKLQNTVLPAGISQVFTPGFNLEKGEGTAERFVKVFTWDAFDQLLPYNGFLQLTAK
ncbi:hypothetical protein [Acetivibrio sp. MSJd-27]|uniref:hypothetical protein n=1 Tax=Acetivibrio sp. MSJd-27 TaxID=2841523 RepID=UPI001C123620|nr:hypothetical protein [Acetivibrio sp. MSJd-27]MBU5450558.1 hypothetical protein [Acetivibrio sp. MSJd-27]